MSEKEINYWFETFKETKHAFMSKDGKILSFYDAFKAMKELQNNWNELKNWLKEVIKDVDEARNSYEKYSLFEERLRSKYFAYNNTLMKMQGLENK